MNIWFIVAAIFGAVASISSVMGVITQQKRDYALEQQNITFQSRVQNYVDEEKIKEKPEIKIAVNGVSHHF